MTKEKETQYGRLSESEKRRLELAVLIRTLRSYSLPINMNTTSISIEDTSPELTVGETLPLSTSSATPIAINMLGLTELMDTKLSDSQQETTPMTQPTRRGLFTCLRQFLHSFKMKIKYKEPTEHQIQAAYFDWVRTQRHDAFLTCFAVPNGSYKSAASAVKFQREGLTSGVPDVLMLYPCGRYHGLALEFKTAKGKLTANQVTMMQRLSKAGYAVELVRSVDDAIRKTICYLNLGE